MSATRFRPRGKGRRLLPQGVAPGIYTGELQLGTASLTRVGIRWTLCSEPPDGRLFRKGKCVRHGRHEQCKGFPPDGSAAV